jgi:hypothetical protein
MTAVLVYGCRNNPMGARMVHFKGKDLLVVAPKNDELSAGATWSLFLS